MALLIDRLPIPSAKRSIALPGGGTIVAKPWQSLVWISITPPQVLELTPATPRFLAVLDTGFNQTLLIQDRHLEEWAGIKASELDVFPGESAVYGQQVWPFRMADIWLHANVPGQQDSTSNIQSMCLEAHPGILIVSERERPQRLPLLGMRAMARNRMQLQIEFPTAASGFLSVGACGR